LPWIFDGRAESTETPGSTPRATPTRTSPIVLTSCPAPRALCRICPGCTDTPTPMAGTPTVCPDCRSR
jgi:hypothetical protein